MILKPTSTAATQDFIYLLLLSTVFYVY